MYKALKKREQAIPLIEQNELKKLFIKYLMRRSLDWKIKNNSQDYLLVKEILQEQYNSRGRSASVSRNLKICPFTGRTRGYYNFAKLSRVQFKQLAGAGVLPGFRKAS